MIDDFNFKQIAFCGDWHANRQFALDMLDSFNRYGIKAIVQLGDFGYKYKTNYLNDMQKKLEEYDMYLFFVDGNHEEFPKLYSYPIIDGVRPLRDRIVHLPRGLRWTWNGHKFLALGGAPSIDKDHRVVGKSWWIEEQISFNEADRAMQGGTVDVMLTHDCPTGVDIPGITKTAAYGWPEHALKVSEAHRDLVRMVVDEVKPKKLLHGHYHRRYDGLLVGEDYKTEIVGLDADIGRWIDNFIVWNTDE